MEIGKKLGATHTLNAAKVAVYEKLAEIHGTVDHFGKPLVGTDVFIEASGAPLIADIIANCKPKTRLCLVAGYHREFQQNFNDVMNKELEIIGSFMYSDDFGKPIALLSKLDVSALITHRFKLDDFEKALAAGQQKEGSAKIMIEVS